jgi:BirA family biotin operon repressor/biotin-[acetyl-CoA-carboxylase] ligase
MLKWPNDIIINNRNCGGILIENLFSQNNLSHTIAIGIGINLKISPVQSTFPSSNIMKEFDIDIERDDFLNLVNINMMDLINIWSKGENFKEILNSWRLKAYLINKEIFVSLPNGDKASGIFSSIDEEGGLILTNNDGEKDIFYAAEIFEGL